jgi:flavin-dependent dehydrogenase
MNRIDDREPVVIIGASAAGLFAAQLLAERKVPVHVYERATELVPRSRTLIVTPELQRVLGFSPASATLNKIHTLELCSTAKTAPIALREPDLIVERAELIRTLAHRAVEAGAQLHLAHDFLGFESDRTRTHVLVRERGRQSTKRVSAGVVIGADGVRSRVARSLGETSRPTVTVLQARVPTPPLADAGVGKVWFLPHETQYFYWLCPESDRFAAVGLVDADPRQARSKLDRFLVTQGMQPLEYQAALIPLYTPAPSPVRRVGHTEVLFVGDAAGQVKVTTIGGTVSGLRGARAAAEAIAHGKHYLSELRAVDGELRLHWRIRALMNRFTTHEYDALVQLLSGRLGKLLEIHNRDRLAGAFWPIVAVQPRLSLLAARVLWRVGFQA